MRRAAVVGLTLLLAACARDVGEPEARRERPVAPITALQVRDLLSPDVGAGDGNLFDSVDPDRCSGVAREVDPPFISTHGPVATDGGHWMADNAGNEVNIEEMVGVFHADYDAAQALADARRTIAECRGTPFTVSTLRGREYAFELLPQVDSGSPQIVLWSFAAVDWACDSAFVAAHNAAIEISTCGPINGYDVRTLAADALKRIETLANRTA